MSRRDVIGWKYPPQYWWPELPGKSETASNKARMCPDCNRVALDPRQRFCGKCAYRRRLNSINRSRRARVLTVKANSPKVKKASTHHTPDGQVNC